MNLEFEQNITTRGARKRAHTDNIPLNVERSKTPTRSTIICEAPKTPVNALKQHNEQTPRRSGRKSVRPIQDYCEIVSGINLRSHMSVAEFDNEDHGTETKWTPAKVGRVSQKRSTRKSARKSKKHTKEANQHVSVLETNEHEKSLHKNQQENDALDSFTNEEKTVTYDDGHQKTSVDLLFKDNEISTAESFTDGDLNRTFEKQEENGKVENRTVDVVSILDVAVAPTVYDNQNTDEASKSVTKDIKDSCLVESVQTNGKNSYDSNGLPEMKKKIDYHITADSCNEVLDEVTLLDKKQEKYEEIEMPSLLLCEDDDEDNQDQRSNTSQRGNDTFNKSDCVVMSPTTDANGGGKEVTAEGALSLNGVDSPLVEAEKKVKEIQMKYFNSNKKDLKNIQEIKVQPATPVPDSAKKPQRKTPIKKGIANKTQTKSLKSGYRFPTPFKNKPDFKFSKSENEDAAQDLFSASVVGGHVTSLQPKDIVLRSIRKRSLSLTVDGDQRKRKIQNVTFYSPANQTVTTADLDQLLAKGIQEHHQKDQPQKGKAPRKRSNSLDENYLPSKLPKPVPVLTKKGKSPGKSTSRTKLPNFAAIHEKQFQKMENLVDYVARKADRAQNLTNSALKARNALKSPRKPLTETASMLPLKVVQTNFVVKTSATAFSSEKNKLAAARNLPMSEKSNKLQERRQRHMDILKGRADKETDLKRKNNDIIKGVRSNRRFELLMQHRKTTGN